MKSSRIFLFFFLFFPLVMTGCDKSKYVHNGNIKDVIYAKESRDYIETIGIGAADALIVNSTRRRAVSRNAAVVDAQYRLLSFVQGLTISGGVTVEQAMQTDSSISAIVDGYLQGAQEVKMEWTKDDGCLVTMRLYTKHLKSKLNIVD